MKIKISYFYMIRFFKPNQIPISTAVWDPKWFHNFTGNPNYKFLDKNNVLNGIRLKDIVPNEKLHNCCRGRDNCASLNPESCEFLSGYKKQLNEIDFNAFIRTLEAISSAAMTYTKSYDEPEVILIVYETPNNPCSERRVLIDWFASNGYELDEYRKE